MTSIRNEATYETYKSLYQKDNMDDDKIPSSMRNAIDNLVMDNLKRDKDKLEQELTQLRNFLNTLQLELSQIIGKNNICKLCNFTYTSSVQYKRYSETNDDWMDINKGLFGYDRDGTTYINNLASLNDYLYMQFFKDYHNREGKRGSGVVGDYKYILKESETWLPDTGTPYPFNDYSGIFNYRNAVLATIHGLVGKPAKAGDWLI